MITPFCSWLLPVAAASPRLQPVALRRPTPLLHAGAYETAEVEELLGAKLTDLYEGNASALRVLAANGAGRGQSARGGQSALGLPQWKGGAVYAGLPARPGCEPGPVASVAGDLPCCSPACLPHLPAAPCRGPLLPQAALS